MANSDTRVPSIWTTGWTDVLNTGTWRNAVAVHEKKEAPCRGACPVDGEIPVWVQQVRNKEYQGAWLTLVENNPIPAAIGRTCHHPCEGGCNRGEYDGAIPVNALEQFLGDMAIREGWQLPAPQAFGDKKVAVVGGGPAGLSCAYHLRRKGFQVTLYDANPELGGVLRYGVPEYRLPKSVLAAEVARIVGLGIDVVAGCTVTGEDLAEIEKHHSAVFIAFGAHAPKSLPHLPKNDSRVIDGIAFLRSVRTGSPMKIGGKVVVIGGGSVAMDVAGCALRLGSKSCVVSLEKRGEMPAPQEEVEDALDEGALLVDGAMIKRVEELSGRFTLHLVKVDLDPAAPAGVLRPLEIAGSEFTLEADTIITAIGQDPNLTQWEGKVAVERSMVLIDERYMTSRPGLFAAGDLASAERFVSTAVGDGKRAAQSIARYLGCQEEAKNEAPLKEVKFQDINTFYFANRERAERAKVDPVKRNTDFTEIRLGLGDELALTQAERCFSCGNCVKCDNCLYFCPDMAISRDDSSPLHYKVNGQYCKGCGCCLEECPRGAVGVLEEKK